MREVRVVVPQLPILPYVAERIRFSRREDSLTIALRLRGPSQMREVFTRTLGVGTGHSQARKDYYREHYQARKDYYRDYDRRQHREIYAQALATVAGGPVECMLGSSECKGRLEIAHTRQDGNKDRTPTHGADGFYRRVVSGMRPTDDLAIFCITHHRRFDAWMRRQMEAF